MGLFKDQRGFTTVEWLIITFLGASASALVIAGLKPELVSVHNNVVGNIIGIVSSGL